jgi:dTDP-4-amino-4,6-dideoxygalactose transaminase
MKNFTRRQFIATTSAGTVTTVLISGMPSSAYLSGKGRDLALLGGKPIREKGWPEWPIWNRDAEDPMLEVLRSGKWYREWGNKVEEFEVKYAEMMNAKRCLATASGTTALQVALQVLGIDAGDEVIVAPYTFIATYNVVFMQHALPVFADTDRETFTINPDKIEEKITERTRAIMPVHILGLPADMDRINAIAKKHNLAVIEDACQAWLAEYKNQKCGTLGDLGCFSFQNSKHLTSGEGGAVLGNDDDIMDRCHSFHNCGRPYGKMVSEFTGYPTRGSNKRMTEIQATILMSQIERIKADADLRLKNAQYLDSKIKEIPGLIPYKLASGATRSAYHLYPFRYDEKAFGGVPRSKFLEALRAEGISCSGGYKAQYRDGLMEEALQSRGFQRLFSKERLDRYRADNEALPDNDQLCEEAVWFFQYMLLGSQEDMDDIVNALTKVYENRGKLV